MSFIALNPVAPVPPIAAKGNTEAVFHTVRVPQSRNVCFSAEISGYPVIGNVGWERTSVWRRERAQVAGFAEQKRALGNYLNVTQDKATELFKPRTATNVLSEIGSASYTR